MRILVTGGAGGLGISICNAFLRDGFDVRVFDLDNPVNRRRIRKLSASADIFWGDITYSQSVREATEDIDAVVHLAACLPPLAEENPETAERVNIGGTQAIVDMIKERGDKIPFIYSSSTAVFGPTPEASEPLHPDKNIPNPNSVYGKTKLQAEHMIKESGIDYLILRLTSTPYLYLKPSDTKHHLFSVPLKNRIEFCHPDDVALAILNAVKKFSQVKNRILIIAGGQSQQILYEDLLHVFLGAFGLPLPPSNKFSKEPHYLDWYDTEESQELLQFQTRTLNDYSRDLVKQYPAPLMALMRYFIGPVVGKLVLQFI